MGVLLILLAGLQVHEWGVIVQNPVSFTATPVLSAIPVEDPVYMFEDKAPVVYFHGDPCIIDMRISFPAMGYATSILPEASDGGINSTYAAWNRLELTDSPDNELSFGWPSCELSGLPAQLWREVDALDVVAYGCFDRFLYYECVPGSPGDLPFISQSGNQSLRMPYGEIPCIVLTSAAGSPMYGVFTLAEILNSIPKGLQFLEHPEILRRELWQWAEGTLNEDEFETFWGTWESSFIEDCMNGVVILYPVPEEILENIASIEIIPDREMEVEINRFVIAKLPYRTE